MEHDSTDESLADLVATPDEVASVVARGSGAGALDVGELGERPAQRACHDIVEVRRAHHDDSSRL
jgi:hypothetical protein